MPSLLIGTGGRGMIDNGGPAIRGISEVDSSPQEEMAAFDQLAPQVRCCTQRNHMRRLVSSCDAGEDPMLLAAG
jgi:hypothetical protein